MAGLVVVSLSGLAVAFVICGIAVLVGVYGPMSLRQRGLGLALVIVGGVYLAAFEFVLLKG